MQSVSYTSLEPSNLQALGVKTPSFDAGSSASFFATSSFLYSLFFTTIVIAAAYRYVVAGSLRIQASESSLRQSNDIVKRVTLGLLGVFSLFLILFTVNKGLVNGEIGLDALYTGKGNTSAVSGVVPVGAQSPTGAEGAPSGNGDMQNAINEDPSIREKLRLLGITVNKSVCSSPSETNCTTVGGMNPGTFSMLQSLKNTCSGTIQITGGTEAGHKSHGPGLTPVDLSINDQTLNACILRFNKGPNVGSWCKETYTNFGYIFCNENNTEAHWHVYK